MKRNRAWRRFQEKRILKKEFHILKDVLHENKFGRRSYEEVLSPEAINELWVKAKLAANNRKLCSCSSCCNQRRNDWLSKKEQLTIQERRAFQDAI